MERATAADLSNLHIRGLLEGDVSRLMKVHKGRSGGLVLSETNHKDCGKRSGGVVHGGVGVAQEIYHDLLCGRSYWKEERGDTVIGEADDFPQVRQVCCVRAE